MQRSDIALLAAATVPLGLQILLWLLGIWSDYGDIALHKNAPMGTLAMHLLVLTMTTLALTLKGLSVNAYASILSAAIKVNDVQVTSPDVARYLLN